MCSYCRVFCWDNSNEHTTWHVHQFIDFVYISYLLYFPWVTSHFGMFMDILDLSFWTIFHFCFASLLIFIFWVPSTKILKIAGTSDKPELRLDSQSARPPGHGKPAFKSASEPASHPSKNDTISFIKLSQIHYFLARSGLAPFWLPHGRAGPRAQRAAPRARTALRDHCRTC